MKYLLLLFTVLISQASFSQSVQNVLSVTFGATTLPTFNDQKFGFNLSTRYYFTDAFSAGISGDAVHAKYNKGFGYDTNRTILNSYNLLVPLQYDFLNTKDFSLGLGISNGVLWNVLSNKNETEVVDYFNDETNMFEEIYIPKKLKTDAYYVLTPYVDLSYRIFNLDKDETASMFVNAKLGYQNVFGNGSFSKSNDFSNYVISLGFTIKGALD